jgi:hypothetical protein
MWNHAFSNEIMPIDLDMVGGDGPAATHGVCIVFMMGLYLEPHVPGSAQAWAPPWAMMGGWE